MEWWNALHSLFNYDEKSMMLFNSGHFLYLFSAFFLIYAFIYKNVTVRLCYVIAFSLLFYYKSSGWYLFILLFSVILDYWVALVIYKAKNRSTAKAWLVISLVANVGLLAYFKYTNFFISNFNLMSGGDIEPLDLFLPIGISFYTFQTISYVVDVYQGKLKPVRNILDYTFYMTFFPHLVAGPIVRAKDFLPQVRQPLCFSTAVMGEGLYLILKGLVKKAIIADYISQYVDLVFDNPKAYSGFENLMAVYAYTLQIYFDFSGYSDIAIGIALWLGYRLVWNFNRPYISKNITEFWRRWHISLSSWLRDYIYIPLGGNRKGVGKQYIFLMLTMLIGGLWHGPSWKFVAWGGLHGVALAIHKLYHRYIGQAVGNTILHQAFGGFVTFHWVALLWVFFRASDFNIASQIFTQIFTQMDLSFIQPFVQVRYVFVSVLLIGYLFVFIPNSWKKLAEHISVKLPILAKAVCLLLVIGFIISLTTDEVKPFIYFQF